VHFWLSTFFVNLLFFPHALPRPGRHAAAHPDYNVAFADWNMCPRSAASASALDASKKTVKVRPCEPATVSFTATNAGRIPLVGQAIFGVAPSEASVHLAKTECFCFTEQRLEAGQSREMPVRFVIDDQLPADVSRLTFRYVFNPVAKPLAMSSAVAQPNS
jgi:cytochrome c oxidase assembly protein Cox11